MILNDELMCIYWQSSYDRLQALRLWVHINSIHNEHAVVYLVILTGTQSSAVLRQSSDGVKPDQSEYEELLLSMRTNQESHTGFAHLFTRSASSVPFADRITGATHMLTSATITTVHNSYTTARAGQRQALTAIASNNALKHPFTRSVDCSYFDESSPDTTDLTE